MGKRAGQRTLAVALIGFMGAGKSSVGRVLADRLDWKFEDLDQRIARREGRQVHQIFREDGEKYFRRLESGALEEVLSELHPGAERVIALGGGAFVHKQNARVLEAARVPAIFLDADVKELWRRCAQQSKQEGFDRPLSGDLDSFEKLYNARRSCYLKASYRHDTGGKTLEKIAAEVMQALGLKGRRRPGKR